MRRLLDAISRWYIRHADVYPPRWYFPIVRIYGGPDGQRARTCYMTRVILSLQRKNWRQLYLHIFHREDMDRDPHDHPFGFWTFPINQGYYEEVYEHDSEGNPGCWRRAHVPRWRWSYRPAEHTHRVVSTDRGTWPLVTLVLRSKNQRRWGFWCHVHDPIDDQERSERHWVPYQDYVYGGVNANVDGNDVTCPGGVNADATVHRS